MSHERNTDKVDFINIKNVSTSEMCGESGKPRAGEDICKPLSVLVFRMNTGLLSPKQDRQRGVEMGGR